MAESFLTVEPYAHDLESKMNAMTDRISELAVYPNSSTSRVARDMFRKIAVDVGVFATRLHEVNDMYIDVTNNTRASLEFIASFEASKVRPSIPETLDSLSNLQNIQLQFITYRNQLVVTTSEMESLPHIERSFDREVRRAISEIRSLADNFDKTIDAISYVIGKYTHPE